MRDEGTDPPPPSRPATWAAQAAGTLGGGEAQVQPEPDEPDERGRRRRGAEPVADARSRDARTRRGEQDPATGTDADAAEHPGSGQRSRVAANTVIFSIATGLSRIAGLAREVVAAGFYGVTGPISAFTLAFQIPNLVRSLVADSALTAAFVPVFTELLQQNKKKEAYSLAGSLFGLILVALGAITVLFIVVAPFVVPLFTGGSFTEELDALTVLMSQIMFPIVVLLGLNGLVVGILNTYDHFSIPAIAPLVWNVVIIACMAGLKPFFDPAEEVYAYAIGILVGTAVQFAMALPVLRRVGFPLRITFHRDPRIRQVLRLMFPVTIGLGLINFNLIINSVLGTLVSEEAPRAIDAAFRIYMLPQGMFSVAVATVLYPTLSRLAAKRDLDGLRQTSALGVRQIFLLLVPAAAATLALAEPITRVIYERGPFDAQDTELVASALFWFSFSLPFSGANLLLTRTFFSLQETWTPTKLAGITLAANIIVSAALYTPLGVAGIVIGTVVSSALMTVLQAVRLGRRLNGLEARATLLALLVQVLAAGYLGCIAYVVFQGVDDVLGRSLLAQLASVATALSLGTAVYAGILLWLDLPEAHQVARLISSRLPGRLKRG